MPEIKIPDTTPELQSLGVLELRSFYANYFNYLFTFVPATAP